MIDFYRVLHQHKVDAQLVLFDVAVTAFSASLRRSGAARCGLVGAQSMDGALKDMTLSTSAGKGETSCGLCRSDAPAYPK